MFIRPCMLACMLRVGLLETRNGQRHGIYESKTICVTEIIKILENSFRLLFKTTVER